MHATTVAVDLAKSVFQIAVRAGKSWAWFWGFPSHKLSVDPQTSVERRHHLYEERLNRALKKAVAQGGTASPLDALAQTLALPA